jgi:hypothetical protein
VRRQLRGRLQIGAFAAFAAKATPLTMATKALFRFLLVRRTYDQRLTVSATHLTI